MPSMQMSQIESKKSFDQYDLFSFLLMDVAPNFFIQVSVGWIKSDWEILVKPHDIILILLCVNL